MNSLLIGLLVLLNDLKDFDRKHTNGELVIKMLKSISKNWKIDNIQAKSS